MYYMMEKYPVLNIQTDDIYTLHFNKIYYNNPIMCDIEKSFPGIFMMSTDIFHDLQRAFE